MKFLSKDFLSLKPVRMGSYFLSFGLILLVAYFTYFHNYDYPREFFWDEQYHIPSAQKYLNGVFFMEPHPPLGKLLIALGEKLLHPNAAFDQYRDTDFAGNVPFPEGFSFTGYRFFPVLAAWLTAPIVLGIFLLITHNQLFSVLLSCLYLFDNALIVHMRGAMLEGILLFFMSLTLLLFLLLLKWRDRPVSWAIGSALLGISFGLAVTTKVTGLILLLLFPALLFKLWPDWKKSLFFVSLSCLGFAIAFACVWQIHFALASEVNPKLSTEGYFGASEQYKQILVEKRSGKLSSFPIELRESLAYIPQYNQNVPKLDLCNTSEGGSPAFFWPLGARTINYRWESPDGFLYRYLYLQSNPVVWATGLLGTFLSTTFLVSSTFLPLDKQLQNRFLIALFLAMYLGYMFVMLTIKRTMYLYHYFPPLLFSFFMFGLALVELDRIANWTLGEKAKVGILAVFAAGIFLSFQFYHPLTYYEPLTDVAFRKRVIFPLWDLRCINCQPRTLIWEAKDS